MKKNISYKVISIAFSVLTVCFLMVFYSLAWTDPSANPPNNNVSTPLNISSTGQTKSGGLILNTAGAENGLIVRYGNVGIGTLSPQSPLTVSGEVHLGVMSSFQQEGKVIIGRSGATLRNHEIKAFNSSTASQNYLTFGIHNGMYDGVTNYVTDALTIRGDGRVGIGTASPSQALDVQGNIVASGSICANGGSDCIGAASGPAITRYTDVTANQNLGVHDVCFLDSFRENESTDRDWCVLNKEADGSWVVSRRYATCHYTCLDW